MFPAGIEPATSPVWRVRDNHYTKETDNLYLVVRILISLLKSQKEFNSGLKHSNK